MITTFTVYTRQLFNKFANIITSSQKRRVVINYTVGVLLFVVAAYCLATRKYILATFFAIFGTLFSCSRLISMAFINRINARQLNTYDRYSFQDGKFTVNSFLAGGTPYSQTEHQYKDVVSIDFFTTFAYVYLATGETYILLRENFKCPEQFDWLMQNLMATANAKKLGVEYTMPSVSEYLKNFAKERENSQVDVLDKMLAERSIDITSPAANVDGNASAEGTAAKTIATRPAAAKTVKARPKAKTVNSAKKANAEQKTTGKMTKTKTITAERKAKNGVKKSTTKAKTATTKPKANKNSAREMAK